MLDQLALSFPAMAVVMVILFFAYFIRGIAGFGSALIAMPLLTLQLDFVMVVPIICLLDYLASLSQGFKGRRHICYADLWPLLPFTVVGVLCGTYLLANLDTRVMAIGLAAFIISFACYSLLPLPQFLGSRRWAVPAGFCGGTVGAVFSTGGPFYVIYYRLRDLDKSQFRATISISFAIDGTLRIIAFICAGLISWHSIVLFLLLVPVMFVGLYCGGKVHVRISQQNFVRLVSGILLLSGLVLLVKNL